MRLIGGLCPDRMSAKKTTSSNEQSSAAEFLPANAMAKRLGVSGKTVARWAAAGYISPRKLSRKTVLFRVTEVLAYVESCKV